MLFLDVQLLGFVGAVELATGPGGPTQRGFSAYVKLYEAGLLCRTTGDTIAFAPPLIAENKHIDFLVDTLGKVIKSID